MNYKYTTLITAAVFGLSVGAASATVVDGLAAPVDVTGTTGTATLDASVIDLQSAFAQEFAINSGNSANCVGDCQSTTINGEEFFFGTIALGDLGVNSDGTFSLVYDIQEAGNDDTAIINDLIVAVGGTTLFDYDEVSDGDILLQNSDSPLGNGADLQLVLDTGLLDGFSASDVLTLFWQDEGGSNGADEWFTAGDAFFEATGPISPVPLPATGLMLLAGIAGFGAMSRRRKS